jgi:O-antigen/teichoic acid export membrane protein
MSDARPPSARFPRIFGGDGALARWLDMLMRHPSAMLVANTGLQSVLRLASNVILARLLTPDAFALTAIVMIILTGLQMISDVGIAVLALREGEMDEEREARLWTMQMVRGLGLAAVVCVLSEPIAWLYDAPELGTVMRVLSLMPALQGAQGLYPVLAFARRDLLPFVAVELGGRVFGTVVSIAYALVSPTVWALVAGTLAQFVASAIVSHRMAGRVLPRLVFDWRFMAEQWQFARWIQLSSTFTFIGQQIDKALFPFLFGLNAFGLYTIGGAFAAIPQQITQRWNVSVFYPLAVEHMRDGPDACRRLCQVRFTMLLYAVVLTLAMVAGAPMFFQFLYRPEYHQAAWFAQLTAAILFFDVAEGSLRNLLLADDSPKYEAPTVSVRIVVFLALAGLVYWSGAGPAAYAVAYLGGNIASWIFVLGVDVRRGYLRAAPDLLLAVPLLVAEAAVWRWPMPRLEPLAAAVGCILVGILTLAGVGWVYVRRGFPSLPKEPAPLPVVEANERDLAERSTGIS